VEELFLIKTESRPYVTQTSNRSAPQSPPRGSDYGRECICGPRPLSSACTWSRRVHLKSSGKYVVDELVSDARLLRIYPLRSPARTPLYGCKPPSPPLSSYPWPLLPPTDTTCFSDLQSPPWRKRAPRIFSHALACPESTGRLVSVLFPLKRLLEPARPAGNASAALMLLTSPCETLEPVGARSTRDFLEVPNQLPIELGTLPFSHL